MQIGRSQQGSIQIDRRSLVDTASELVNISSPTGDEFWVDRETGLLVRALSSGDDASELNFDSWDAVERVKAPPKAKVLRK